MPKTPVDRKVTLIATTDWHLDARTAGHPRREDLRRSVNVSMDRAIALKEHRSVVYAFGGDLTDPDSLASHAAVAFAVGVAMQLREVGIESIWCVGNHDRIEDGSGDHALMALEQLGPGVHVCSAPEVLRINGLSIGVLPYPSTSHPYDPERFVKAPLGQVDVWLGHLTVPKLIPGSEASEMARGRDVYWPVETLKKKWPSAIILAGHHHHKQVFNGVHIIGSLGLLTFGDSHAPGLARIDFA